jgi:hypothetical protein
MASRHRSAKGSPALSERQGYWLKHIRTAERQGEPLKHYAARLGLPVHSLYEAKRRLRALGVVAPAPARRAESPRFARVTVKAPSGSTVSPLRVRLGSGAVLEWSEAPQGDALRELVGMLS